MNVSIHRFRSTQSVFHRLATLAVLVPLTFAGLGLAACEAAEEREPEIAGGEEAVTADEGAASDDYFADDPEAPAAGTSAVEVRLHGRQIDMPSSLPAGETTFLVTNTGDDEHSFEIEGNGIEEELEDSLQAGESGELTVDLEPGTYTVYCPVGDHESEGMVTTLRVVG